MPASRSKSQPEPEDPLTTRTDELLGLFRTMTRIREFEQRVANHFRAGDIHGFVHVSIGQEGVAVAACGALGPSDVITTTHRGHGHCLAKGASPRSMMAELFGRATGLCGGRGGSMHLADPSIGILGANGIVGAGIPLAVGAGLAAQINGDDRICVAFFGEGAVHTGAFHEGLCLAVAWKLPVVFVCECNGWAEFTSAGAWPGPRPAERAAAYGLASSRQTGADVLTLRDSMIETVGAVRSGDGPAFVEVETCRLHGHYEGDAQSYRSSRVGEDEFIATDPIANARRALGHREAEVRQLERDAVDEMDAAVSAALGDPYPDPASVLDYVYA